MPQSTEPTSPKRIELILQQLDQLPTLPTVAVKVLEVTGADPATVREVVKLISSDPAMTARILQLVHRAEAGVRGDVFSVERAVVLLGFEAVRSAVLAISVFETLEGMPGKPDGHFVREDFWKHSLAVACCAELLADQINQGLGREEIHAGEAFVCGLLHDIGKVALDATLPKSFDRVVEAADLLRANVADLERQVIGVDHMVIGKRLAERWQFPVAIRECIWLHGQMPQALPATVRSPRLVNLITLSDLLVREQHIGYSGNYAFALSRQLLSQAVGLREEQVTRATAELVERIEARANALGLGRTSSRELYQQALSQANKELGHLSGQMAAKNRKLSVRAKFFDALSQFQAGLRPDAPPQTVLKAIGQTAIPALGARCCCVFSLQPGQTFAEALLFDDSGEAFESTLVDCPARPALPTSGTGPVLPAAEEMEWLVSVISPRLSGSQRFWICLAADGQCIGGVVWGGEAGEAQRQSPQVQELTTISSGWSLALRMAQIREESRALSEQLAEANRQLQNAQGEILRSRMLSSVGEMAAGAAHEMNNPLAIISGRSQLLAQQLPDAKLQHSARLIFEQSHRLSEIITELMVFARPVPPKPIKVEPAELLERALHEAKMRSDPADRTIELTMGDVPAVMVDPQQITDAIREVIENAIQATEAGPKGHVGINAAYDAFSSRVAITVTDNGCGMDEKTVRQAFDPFFSAKPAGRRRGMGLAKAMRWVEGSGGSIRLESRVQQGTRALILLPAVKDERGREKSGVARKAAQ